MERLSRRSFMKIAGAATGAAALAAAPPIARAAIGEEDAEAGERRVPPGVVDEQPPTQNVKAEDRRREAAEPHPFGP